MKVSIKLEKRIPNFNNEEMIRRARETGDRSIRDTIIKNNMHLVIKLVNRAVNNGSREEPDELVSMGMIGLMKAYDSFDTDKNIKFSTYLSTVVMREFAANARAKGMKCQSKYNSVSLEGTVYKGKGTTGEKTLSDVVADESHLELSGVEDAMFEGVLESDIMRKLSPKEQIVSRKYFFDGLSLSDIGREMNVSRQAAHQYFKSSVKKLAPAFV